MNALMMAVVGEHEECVRVLIAAKADVACASRTGKTALHLTAACRNVASICRVLIDEGASLTAVDSNGQTPLELAKERRNAECVAILEAAAAAVGGAV